MRLQLMCRTREAIHWIYKRASLLSGLVILVITIVSLDISLGGTTFGPCRTNQRLLYREGSGTQDNVFVVAAASACQPCRRPYGGYLGSPVSVAAGCGDYVALQAILEAVADPNDQFCQTSPMMSLASCGHDERTARCAQLLLDYGAKIHTTNALDENAIHVAASYARPNLLKWLIYQGVDVDKRDFQGNTPVHHLARDAIGSPLYSSEDEIRRSIEVLIEGGADLRIRNDDGKTAIELIKPHEIKKREFFEAAIRGVVDESK